MPATIDICVTDDHPLFRKAIVRLLQTFARIGNLYEAENGKQCLEVVAAQKVDIVLLDMEMPVMNGLDVARVLVRDYPDIKIVVLTMHDSEAHLRKMLEIGVHSFLLKTTHPEELQAAIHAVVDRDFYHNEMMMSALRKTYTPSGPKGAQEADLSPRELEILRLIYEDLSLKEIGQRLQISEHTVHRHKHNLQQKLGVNGTAGLIKWALQQGVVL
ncbi:MAG: response regulator transcription factor [Cyclobacteriaceae bacterium]|jgi:DNA-binding NarL/FixJ family response regulator|nr:response regulator transcription factor [Cyclobacteriaceae bacterium]